MCAILVAAAVVVAVLAPLAVRAPRALGDDRAFPRGFRFGCATASYQVEGAWNESGKGENIWDRLVHADPKAIADLSNGDVACDSYHKYKEDVALLESLGMDVYRFSLSWSRLLPAGSVGVVSKAGVAYYNNLITELLSKGIQPVVTLYHWDLPQPLQDLGGWPNPLLADYYLDYANVAFGLFGDRVKMWITFNEPFETCANGYGAGNNAPNVHMDGVADYQCAHTVLRAHARAYRLYRQKYASAQRGQVGITLNSEWFEARNASSEEDNLAAARAREFKLGWFAHPIFSEAGDYPPVMKERVMMNSLSEGLARSRLPTFTPAEAKALKGSADFLGLNHYSTYLVTPSASGARSRSHSATTMTSTTTISREKDAAVTFHQDGSWPGSASAWLKVVPWGFRRLLIWIRDEYHNPPVMVTESGFSDHGELKDMGRIAYYTSYLEEFLQAIHKDGCQVFGYIAWSLMDNFEWNDGYTARFGLHYVNFSDPARPRLPKASTALFKKLTSTRRLPLAEETEKCLKQKHGHGLCYADDNF